MSCFLTTCWLSRIPFNSFNEDLASSLSTSKMSSAKMAAYDLRPQLVGHPTPPPKKKTATTSRKTAKKNKNTPPHPKKHCKNTVSNIKTKNNTKRKQNTATTCFYCFFQATSRLLKDTDFRVVSEDLRLPRSSEPPKTWPVSSLAKTGERGETTRKTARKNVFWLVFPFFLGKKRVFVSFFLRKKGVVLFFFPRNQEVNMFFLSVCKDIRKKA